MDLSPEDSLRLNVLLANKPQAVRLDEAAMVVYGLFEQGEAKVSLNPTCRDEQYLKRVRELLSGHVTGSPGGYPVFLKRWTRMGQMRDESLQQLLLLGEPEAVVAAVGSPGITNELARRAWWAMQDAENARRLLASRAVVEGDMGRVLAQYLLEYLPFETETDRMMESVRLVLQPGLIDASQRLELWQKAARKPAYLVGFLMVLPDRLPNPIAAHPRRAEAQGRLGDLAGQGNPVAGALLRVLDVPGQTFLHTVQRVLQKPPSPEVVNATLDLMRAHLGALRPEGDPDQTLSELEGEARDFYGPGGPDPARACVGAAPDLLEALIALRVLSGLGYGVLRPVLRNTTAVGSLMRRKLEPVMTPLMGHMGRLMGQEAEWLRR